MEYKNKEKTEGTKQQQTHRTQEWTNSYQRERDWGGWVGGEGQGGKRGITISRHNAGGPCEELYNTEKTSSDSIASYYADGQ